MNRLQALKYLFCVSFLLFSQLALGLPGDRTTVTGAIYRPDFTYPKLGKAFRDPRGLIWGDIVAIRDLEDDYCRNFNCILFKSQDQAMKICTDAGFRLPTIEEFDLLRRDLGFQSAYGYSPMTREGDIEVLPHGWRHFWSSSKLAGHSDYGFSFFGLGGFIHERPHYAYDLAAVRCVAK